MKRPKWNTLAEKQPDIGIDVILVISFFTEPSVCVGYLMNNKENVFFICTNNIQVEADKVICWTEFPNMPDWINGGENND